MGILVELLTAELMGLTPPNIIHSLDFKCKQCQCIIKGYKTECPTCGFPNTLPYQLPTSKDADSSDDDASTASADESDSDQE